MNYRIEKKLSIDDNYFLSFLNYLKKFNIKKKFPDRYVLSYYFDNKTFDMFSESEEGILPRKKVRVRGYPNFFFDFKNIKKFYFEEKVSDMFGRRKVSKPVGQINSILKNGIWIKKYGKCRHVLTIFYRRKYYEVGNFRFTIDDMIYANFNSKFVKFQESIIEAKFSNKLLKEFNSLGYISEKRFSKYCEGIRLIYN